MSVQLGPHLVMRNCIASAMGGGWLHSGLQARATIRGPVAIQQGIVLGAGYDLSQARQGSFVPVKLAPNSGFQLQVLAPASQVARIPGGGLIAITSALGLNASACFPRGACVLSGGAVYGMNWARGGCALVDNVAQLDIE